MDKLLSDKELNEAWDNAFEKGVYFDHKPTAEEILTIRLRAIAQAQLDKNKITTGYRRVRMNNPYFIVERIGMDTETSYNKYPEFQVWEEGKQAGIEEVVGWIERETEYYQCGTCDYDRHMRDKHWQRQLKEWGD